MPAKSLQVEIGALVTLSLEGQNGVRSGIHAALNAAREVHAEKRKFRIGHGINERAHQVLSLRNQKVIFPAKGHDPDFRLLACHPADAVAVQSGAIDDVFGGERSASGFDHHFRVARRHSPDLCSGAYGSALRDHDLSIFPADCGVVSDAGAGHQYPEHAAAVRLNLAHLFLLQQAQSGKAVGLSALEQHLAGAGSPLRWWLR